MNKYRRKKNCLIIVGPSITGRRESEVKIRIRTYSDSITSVHQGAGGIEDYTIIHQFYVSSYFVVRIFKRVLNTYDFVQ